MCNRGRNLLHAVEKCQTVTGKSLEVSILESSSVEEMTRHARHAE